MTIVCSKTCQNLKPKIVDGNILYDSKIKRNFKKQLKMCIIYNTIGALNTIQNELVNNKIDDFNTLEELINFQKEVHITEQKIIQQHTRNIQIEKIILEKEVKDFYYSTQTIRTKIKEEQNLKLKIQFNKIDNLPPTHSKIIPTIIDYWINFIIWIKITITHIELKYKIIKFEVITKIKFENTKKRFKYITNNFQRVVKQSCETELNNLHLKKKVISRVNNSIYGAIGEQKVVDTLQKLSDDYTLINDFNYTFKSPLKNPQKKNLIKTIQIDHILIAPSGIFLIETKNWSEHSINNFEIKSPVQQTNRSGYALYKVLNNSNFLKWSLTKHHWGHKKIPVKNIIVFINNKPIEEFQGVKILALSELTNYIKYFPPIYETFETRKITQYLLKSSIQKEIKSKLKISNL